MAAKPIKSVIMFCCCTRPRLRQAEGRKWGCIQGLSDSVIKLETGTGLSKINCAKLKKSGLKLSEIGLLSVCGLA